MRGATYRFNWPRVVCLSLIGITAGTACHHAAAMLLFQNRLREAVLTVESLLLDRPNGIEPDDWNEAVTITLTSMNNVCSYTHRERSDIIIADIINLKQLPPRDSLETLRVAWRSLLSNCDPAYDSYLMKMHSQLRSLNLGDDAAGSANGGRLGGRLEDVSQRVRGGSRRESGGEGG